MDNQLYHHYLQEYVTQAIKNSNGTIPSIAEELELIRIGGFLTRHKDEKKRALADARRAFDEHRHWPLDIILSHLGVESDL